MAIPWVVHCFGYGSAKAFRSTRRPSGDTTLSGRIVFNTVQRFLGLSVAAEPTGCMALNIELAQIGKNRVLVSLVADTPPLNQRHRVVKLGIEVEGYSFGQVEFSSKEEILLDRSYSIVVGDPKLYTFDQHERLDVRNAIWKIEDRYLSSELSRLTVPGLSSNLVLSPKRVKRISAEEAKLEIARQLKGALHSDSWGYLWKWEEPPRPIDGPTLTLSDEMTMTMHETVSALGETILRACGKKPLVDGARYGFEPGTEVIDSVAYALVALRRKVQINEVVEVVFNAVARYGTQFHIDELEGKGSQP